MRTLLLRLSLVLLLHSAKAQAHEIIDTLKAGTYDAGKWAVPF